MTNKELCRALMVADSEDSVVSILTHGGYWDDPQQWRYLGDTENNFGSIGNQQSTPVAALIEKLVNGIDARLLNACLERGMTPESRKAPHDMREAVAMFFEDWDGSPERLPAEAGLVRLWARDKLRVQADLLISQLRATHQPTGQVAPASQSRMPVKGKHQMTFRTPSFHYNEVINSAYHSYRANSTWVRQVHFSSVALTTASS